MPLLQVLPASASNFPWIGCITTAFRGRRIGGTGSLIAPRLVLTAAHVLYDPIAREKATSVDVTFGGQGGITVRSVEVDFPKEWRDPQSDLDTSLVSPYDIGVVILPSAIDRMVTPMPYQTASDSMLTGLSLNVAGYPTQGVVHGSLYGRNTQAIQNGALGSFAKYEKWRLFYPVASVEGMSGGPVYDVDPVSKVRTVRGIHTSLIPTFCASALRIHEDIFQLIQYWASTYRP